MSADLAKAMTYYILFVFVAETIRRLIFGVAVALATFVATWVAWVLL